MEKIKNDIISNKYFIIVMIIGFILLLIQMNQVVMYADDFALAIEANSTESSIIDYFINHYKTFGRWIYRMHSNNIVKIRI